MLVEGGALPSLSASDYTAYDHEVFDLSGATTMPTVSLSEDAWTVAVYEADLSVLDTGLKTTPSSPLAWLAFDGDTQHAFGAAALTAETLSHGTSTGLLMVTDTLPEAGKEKIYPAY